MSSGFQKAVRFKAKLRMALMGPAGSGKTYTALKVAKHFGSPIGLLDTEKRSSLKYAPPPDGIQVPYETFDFMVKHLDQYDPRYYIEAIKEAEAAGVQVLIVDGLSHAWFGTGGALDIHDAATARTKGGSGKENSFAAWREVTPIQNAMIDALLGCQMHLIVTLRTKTAYEVEGGKVTKLGLAPVQRDGVEYEFDVVGDMTLENKLVVTKTRCPMLSGVVMTKPGKELADILSTWLGTGEAVRTAPFQPAQAQPPPLPPAPRTNVAVDQKIGERIFRWNDGLVSNRLCNNGDLVQHIAGTLNLSSNPHEWPEKERDRINAEAQLFTGNCQFSVLSVLLGILKLKWDAVLLKDLGLPEGSKPERLSPEQFKKVRAVLEEEVKRNAENAQADPQPPY